MKKFIVCLLVFAVAFLPAVNAALLPSVSEDFESYSEGARKAVDFMFTEKSLGNIYVTKDPTTSAENKVLRVASGGNMESYFQSVNFNLSKKTELNFKIYKQSEGSMNFYLRDKNGIENNLYFFALQKNKVVFGRNSYKKEKEFKTNTWAQFSIVIDPKNDSIKYYSDLSNPGSLEFEYEIDLEKTFGEFYRNHYFKETLIRFSPSADDAVYYIDDLCIMSDVSVADGVSFMGANVYRIFNGDRVAVEHLRGDTMVFSVKGKAEEENKTAAIMAAIYSSDGKLKSFSASDTVKLDLNYKQIECEIKTSDLAEGDYASIYVVDNMQNISPICEKMDITQAETFFRPAAKETAADIYANHPTKDDHPRVVLTNEDFDRLRAYSSSDADYKDMLAKIDITVSGKDGKSGYLTYKQPVYNVEQKGSLLETSRNVMNRVIPMAYMYQMTGDEKYAAGVWRQVEPVCDEELFADWHPAHFLDTGEMALAVSIAYDWCYDYWTAEQKEYIEKALYRNIIELIFKTTEGKASYNSPAAGTNWGPVCGGGAIAASAAAFHIYPEECSAVISYCVKSLENAIKDYAPDGGYSEGPMYWDYGTTYLTWLISTLESACGSDYGMLKASGLDKTGYFPSYITGPMGAFNYHDSSGENSALTTKLGYYFADRYNDKNLAGIRYNALKNGVYGMGQSLSIFDMLFYKPENINKDFSYTDLPKDKYIRQIETVTMKENMTDKTASFLTLHGGYNCANHGNLDAGAFVLDAGGVRWFKELGGGNYSLPGYFSSGKTGQRWNYYVNRAEGQNTLVINPTERPDQYPLSTSYITKFKENGDDGAAAVLDMSPAYSQSYAADVKRGAMLTNNRKTMIIQDEVKGIFDYDEETDGFQSELYWFAHTAASIEVSPDGRSAVLTQGQKRLHAQIVSDDSDVLFTVRDAAKLETSPKKHELESSYANIKKLTIELKDHESASFAVVFNLLEDNEDEPEFKYEYVPLEQW